MKRALFSLALVAAAALPAFAKEAKTMSKGSHEWDMNATIIEACSCPMFCSCYFGSGHPAGHHNMESHAEEHFCRMNNAVKVNKGHYKDVKLDNAKFWVSGDLGGDFSKGGEWAVVTFDRSLTQPQRDAIAKIIAKLYPLPFKSLTTDEGDISWVAGAEESRATINDGKTAEVVLVKGGFGQAGGKTPVIKDLQYWGSQHNDGFVLMPNSVEAYRAGQAPFEYKGTNGFMITIDITSKDVK
jgi:hypothetical protein